MLPWDDDTFCGFGTVSELLYAVTGTTVLCVELSPVDRNMGAANALRLPYKSCDIKDIRGRAKLPSRRAFSTTSVRRAVEEIYLFGDIFGTPLPHFPKSTFPKFWGEKCIGM